MNESITDLLFTNKNVNNVYKVSYKYILTAFFHVQKIVSLKSKSGFNDLSGDSFNNT